MNVKIEPSWHEHLQHEFEQNLEILNAFDRIQIEYIDGTLLVK